jgi:hypothetical protein
MRRVTYVILGRRAHHVIKCLVAPCGCGSIFDVVHVEQEGTRSQSGNQVVLRALGSMCMVCVEAVEQMTDDTRAFSSCFV